MNSDFLFDQYGDYFSQFLAQKPIYDVTGFMVRSISCSAINFVNRLTA